MHLKPKGSTASPDLSAFHNLKSLGSAGEFSLWNLLVPVLFLKIAANKKQTYLRSTAPH